MKKLLAFLVLLILLYWLVCASSTTGMRWINKLRDQQWTFLQSDKYTYGDLYGISYLKEFRIPKEPEYVPLPKPDTSIKRPYDLYILGDSYLYSYFDKKPDYYTGVKQVYFKKWSEDTLLNADYIQKHPSILLIECVERNAQNRLNFSDAISHYRMEEPKKSQAVEANTSVFSNLHVNQFLRELLYHPTLEANLDYILFSRGLFRHFKEWKSALNEKIFGRNAKDVQIAKDHSFLYLTETTDPSLKGSSFYPISQQEVNVVVDQMNNIQSFYLQKGFKKVLFSIPANPVGIIGTEKKVTNQFIEKLKHHPRLKVELVDASDSLKVNASSNFFKSDSHWNQKGAAIWLSFLNQALEKK